MMERYLTFDEYLTLGGTVGSSEFDRLEAEARAYVDRYTFDRLRSEFESKRSDELKRCMKMLIEILFTNETAAENGHVSSMSNDGVSISYSVASPEQEPLLLRNKIKSIIYLHLAAERTSDGTPLIFGGVLNAL